MLNLTIVDTPIDVFVGHLLLELKDGKIDRKFFETIIVVVFPAGEGKEGREGGDLNFQCHTRWTDENVLAKKYLRGNFCPDDTGGPTHP